MTRVKVEYTVGMARDGIGAVDYMLAEVETGSGVVTLYAEAPASDDGESYDALRLEILEQAAEEGITEDRLLFYYD